MPSSAGGDHDLAVLDRVVVRWSAWAGVGGDGGAVHAGPELADGLLPGPGAGPVFDLGGGGGVELVTAVGEGAGVRVADLTACE